MKTARDRCKCSPPPASHSSRNSSISASSAASQGCRRKSGTVIAGYLSLGAGCAELTVSAGQGLPELLVLVAQLLDLLVRQCQAAAQRFRAGPAAGRLAARWPGAGWVVT